MLLVILLIASSAFRNIQEVESFTWGEVGSSWEDIKEADYYGSEEADVIPEIQNNGFQKLIYWLEHQITRKKSFEEFTELQPEKISDKDNGTLNLSLPSVKSNGTDYAGSMTQKKKSNKKKASKKKANKKKANKNKSQKIISKKMISNQKKSKRRKSKSSGY
ncbi:uncharacterized protein LOC111701386 [Eurytemora carolleeae]|uniref:uncharacterized protein LOC111701386 n=1 Tax=Eurytemora carolleeae TaxID=1294199 RepID=UPI000C7737BC|nr:uncharacterized protein LOC111701386 [Eurytemora carolleeae]|eukprot:XP_023328426.1 uncharacterized protein LOC111701386 [Eurytemora affinis]